MEIMNSMYVISTLENSVISKHFQNEICYALYEICYALYEL